MEIRLCWQIFNYINHHHEVASLGSKSMPEKNFAKLFIDYLSSMVLSEASTQRKRKRTMNPDTLENSAVSKNESK